MHSLFGRISNLLFDLCHFIAALDGKRISVGFHIIEAVSYTHLTLPTIA